MKGKMRVAAAVCAGLGMTVIVGLSAAAASSRPSWWADRAAGRAGAPPSCQRYVLNTHGVDTGNCADPTRPCRTVQYAVRRAAEGDRICVAYDVSASPAVYVGTEQLTRAVMLDGAWSASCTVLGQAAPGGCKFKSEPCVPAKTVLNGLGAGRVISISGHVKPVIRCLTITGGDADQQFGDPDGMNAGGGIYSRDAAPVIVETEPASPAPTRWRGPLDCAATTIWRWIPERSTGHPRSAGCPETWMAIRGRQALWRTWARTRLSGGYGCHLYCAGRRDRAFLGRAMEVTACDYAGNSGYGEAL